MKRFWMICFCVLALVLTVPATPRAQAFDDLPVYFLVYDYSGNVNRGDYNSWRTLVRQAYHFPYYQLIEGDADARERAQKELYHYGNKPDAEGMAAVAAELNATAVVVLQVHDMYQYMFTSTLGWDRETFVRTVLNADIYTYNARGGYGQPATTKNGGTVTPEALKAQQEQKRPGTFRERVQAALAADKAAAGAEGKADASSAGDVNAAGAEAGGVASAAAEAVRYPGEPRYNHKRIRVFETDVLGNAPNMTDLIKWPMGNCINDMEGRPRY